MRRRVLSVALLGLYACASDSKDASGLGDAANDEATASEAEQLEPKLLADSALPMTPSASGMRDVHLMQGPVGDRNFTRPHIPPFRTSNDGRIAMQTKGGAFYLFVPEKIEGSFLGSPNGATILASTEPAVAQARFPAGLNATAHSALCDPGGNPRSCGSDDCYSLVRMHPLANEAENRIELWSTPIEVRVSNPKTKGARIASIEAGTPRRGALWNGVANRVLETATTRDGRLLVARFGRDQTVGWRTDGGTLRRTSTKIFYSVAPETAAPCDARAFSSPFPPTHAAFHRTMRQRYGFAKYRMRDGEGGLVADGANLEGTYPWIDPDGNNLFFTSFNTALLRTVGGQTEADFRIRCVPGTECTGGALPRDRRLIEADGGPVMGVTTVGLWTQGRTVLLDNMLNNTDYSLKSADGAHREVKLYRESAGYVRIGSGRSNTPERMVPPGGSGNSTFIDSTANKFNYLPAMKVNVPRDVTWYISNGKATDVIAFDDWVDPQVLISSEMVQALGPGMAVRADRVQNGAGTLLFKAPSYGQMVGPGRIEPVALGGVRGKGFFVRAGSGLRYDIPGNQPRELSRETWYVGLFLDPRFDDDTTRRRLLEFPDGSAIDLLGRRALSFVGRDGAREDLPLRAVLRNNQFTHLGFRIGRGAQRVEFFQDGMLEIDWQNRKGLPLFRMASGSLWLGRGATNTTGVTGWVDDFKVASSSSSMNDETLCNHALGTLVGVGSGARAAIQAEADAASAAFHARLRAALPGFSFERYLCFDQNRTPDGWVDLNRLPQGVTSVRTALVFPEGPITAGEPRPDSSRNTFCLSCHTDDGSGRRPTSLLIEALTAEPLVATEDDRRRQPSEPPALFFGTIPANYFAPGLPAQQLFPGPEGTPIDPYIHADP